MGDPPVNIEIERLRMQNLRDSREFWFRVVLVLVPTSAAIGGNVITWSDTNRKLIKADENRSRIEDKIDEQHKATKTVAEEVKVASTTAKVVAEEAKSAAQETKTAVAALRTKLEDAPSP